MWGMPTQMSLSYHVCHWFVLCHVKYLFYLHLILNNFIYSLTVLCIYTVCVDLRTSLPPISPSAPTLSKILVKRFLPFRFSAFPQIYLINGAPPPKNCAFASPWSSSCFLFLFSSYAFGNNNCDAVPNEKIFSAVFYLILHIILFSHGRVGEFSSLIF